MFYHISQKFEVIDVAHEILVAVQLAQCNKYILQVKKKVKPCRVSRLQYYKINPKMITS
jgi:hypothetical protein